MFDSNELIQKAKDLGASDLHLICGLPPKARIDGDLENLGTDLLNGSEMEKIAKDLSGKQFPTLEERGELDLSGTFGDTRCRVHLFRAQGKYSAAIRILMDGIPELAELGLPPIVLDVPTYRGGIVLVTGETGAGKSTTLASLINEINHTKKKHIVTLEDPIEYLYQPDLCAINQREVGKDTESFAAGLRASLREDPDVILIGEMRDRSTIETAISAAETGHLVFGTIHTGSAAESVERILNTFPEGMQKQILTQLSMVLRMVISQQLVKKRSGGRVLACEVLVVNEAIRNNIRTENIPMINNLLDTLGDLGMQSMDRALAKLYQSGMIYRDTAMEHARDLRAIKNLIQ